MKRVLLVCAVCAAFAAPAAAQEVPTLSQFLANCSRDTMVCKFKLNDYIVAADTQKTICRPADQSVKSASSEILSWLRNDDKHPAGLRDVPFDDALWTAASTLWPCAPAAPAAPAEPATPADPSVPAAPAGQ
jgi:hypothetical protein